MTGKVPEPFQELVAAMTKNLSSYMSAKKSQCSKYFARRCLSANPRLAHKCKCACGGRNHGLVTRTREALSLVVFKSVRTWVANRKPIK